MSPRRKIDPDREALFVEQPVAPPRQWRQALLIGFVALITVGSIAVSTLVLVNHELNRRATMKDVSVLADVRSFMTTFTSPDPFHANDYVNRVMGWATGEFAKQYREKANEALLRIARSEPTTGTVLDAGVERWNDDGTANVLVATNVSSKSPDGKSVIDAAYRWLVTAKKEGAQWKISSLVQVI